MSSLCRDIRKLGCLQRMLDKVENNLATSYFNIEPRRAESEPGDNIT